MHTMDVEAIVLASLDITSITHKRKVEECVPAADLLTHAASPLSRAASADGACEIDACAVKAPRTLRPTASSSVLKPTVSEPAGGCWGASPTPPSTLQAADHLPSPSSSPSSAAPLTRRPSSAAESSQNAATTALANGALPAAALSWSDLPDDVLLRVTKLLPSHYPRVLRTVCRSWRGASDRLVRFARPEGLIAAAPTQRHHQTLACRFPNLSALDLSCCDAALEVRGPCELVLRSRLRDDSLADLAGLRRLTQLVLRGCGDLTCAGLSHLAALPLLESVDLSHCAGLKDSGLVEGLQGLVLVRGLNFLGCWGLSDHAITLLAALPALQRLVVPPRITDAGLGALAAAPALQRVAVRGCSRITPAGISALLKARCLRRVVISRCPGVSAAALGGVAPNLSIVSCNAVGARRQGGPVGAGPNVAALAAAAGGGAGEGNAIAAAGIGGYNGNNAAAAAVNAAAAAALAGGGGVYGGGGYGGGGGLLHRDAMASAVLPPDLQLLMANLNN